MSDLEARAQWILSETDLRTSQVDAMLAEVEQALTAADAKLKQIPVKVVHNLHAESTPHIGLLGGS
jgi:hypothetical protein